MLTLRNRGEAYMLYLAGVFFVLALGAAGLSLTNFQFARGAGLLLNVLLLLCLVCLAAKAISVSVSEHNRRIAH